MRKTKQFHFSLIELLVVISIILILLSLIQPALRKAIDNAHLAKCLHTLKVNSYGLSLYADDHQNDLPPGNASVASHWAIDSTYYIQRTGGGVVHHPYGLAILYDKSEYMEQPKELYCPFWTHPYRNYGIIDEAGDDIFWQARQFGGYPEGIATRQNIEDNGPLIHIGISYYYRSSFGDTGHRRPNLSLDDPDKVVVTDQFQRRETLWGSAFGHPNSYNALFMDGSARNIQDIGHHWMRSKQPCPEGMMDDEIHWCSAQTHWQWNVMDDFVETFFEDPDRD